MGGAVETAGMIAAGAVVSRAVGSLMERNAAQTANEGTVYGEHKLSGGNTERALATSENPVKSQAQYTHFSSGDALLPRDVAAGNSFKPGGLWFSENNQDDRPQWFRGLDIDSGVVWNASKVKAHEAD